MCILYIMSLTVFTIFDDSTVSIDISGELFSNSYTSDASINRVSDISSVVIGTGVTSIGETAFGGATSLTSVTIPNSVTSIGDNAFQDANKLASITFEDATKITSFGTDVFVNIAHPPTFTFTTSAHALEGKIPGNATFLYGRSVFTKTDDTTVTIDISGELISTSYTGQIKSVVIGTNVTSIGDNAFFEATNLTSVTIPNSVTSIGVGAFRGATGLTSVTIPNSVDEISHYAFLSCTSLTSLTIPNSVTKLGTNSFAGMSGLTSLHIGNGIQKIERASFLGATSLASLIIPDTVYEIVNHAFENLTSLTSLTFPNNANFITINNNVFKGCAKLKSVTIPNSVKSIANESFSNATSLTSVTIPDSVESIGDGAFSGATNLTSVTIPNSVKSIGNQTFRGATSLTSVTIPNSVKSIGIGAFQQTGLTSVIIPNSVTTIGNYAFGGATNLTSVTIPNSVTSIGSWAFSYATSLTSVTIPDSVTSIGDYAFERATNLTSVTFQDASGITFGGAVFAGISSNPTFTFQTATSIPNALTGKLPNDVTIVFEKLSVFTLTNNTTVSIDISGELFSNSYTTDPSINSVSDISSVVIGTGVTSIGTAAFDEGNPNESLTSVTIPNSVTSIGTSAFSNASSLTSVTIGNSVTSIGTAAFYNTGLTSITIPNSVTSIGDNAFQIANKLASITFEDATEITSFGYDVFAGIASNPTFTFQTATSLPTNFSNHLPTDRLTIFESLLPSLPSPIGDKITVTTTFPTEGSNVADNRKQTKKNIKHFFEKHRTSIGSNKLYLAAQQELPGYTRYLEEKQLLLLDTTSKTTFTSSDIPLQEPFFILTKLNEQITLPTKDANYTVQITETSDGVFSIVENNNGIITDPVTKNAGNQIIINSLILTLGSATGIIDSEPPTITLNGDTVVNIDRLETYTELGAVFTDNADASYTITDHSSGSVDINTVGTYTLTYSATDTAGNSASVDRTVNVNICFIAGTPIQTDQGKIPIEKLDPKIHTIRGKPIVAITKNITPDDSLICFEANSLGKNLPCEKTIMSMNHKLFYQGKMIRAKFFTGNKGIYKIPYKQEVLYNVLLETHDKMMVNNMICETLDPENSVAQLYIALQKVPKEKHASVFSQYNAFCKEHNIYGTDNHKSKKKEAAFKMKL